MRIYFIGQKGIPTLAGGIERHVESLAVEMTKRGHEVFVYVRPWYTNKQLKEYQGVHLISLPSLRTKNLDAITHTCLATLHVLFQPADIIHYQGIGPSLLSWIPRLFKWRAKVLSTVHSDDRQHDKWSRFAKCMLGLGARIGSRVPHASIAISRHQKEEFDKEFGSNLIYIPNGVTPHDPIAPDQITKRWGLVGDDYILFVARFVKHKGLHYLIRAYNMIHNPTKKLVIVGGSVHTDEYTEKINDMVAGNDNIIMTGFVSGQAMIELYANAYLFVIPSEYEGLSIALLEVMSYGTPVLASNIKPNLEALGGLGFTFENKNISDLHMVLEELLMNPDLVQRSGPPLRQRVLDEYDWGRITEQTLALYERLRQ